MLVRDAEPALWALEQRYRGPDGQARTRRGFFARVRVEEYGPGRIRPHERTHPGPQGGPPAPDARDAREPLADLRALLGPRPPRPTRALAPATRERAVGRGRPTPTAPRTASGAARDPTAIATVAARRSSSAELLIADGHHRYETARAYAEEIGGEGEHRYVLMCLVALEDPGLDDLPDPPPRRRPRRRAAAPRSPRRSSATSRPPPVAREQLAPPPGQRAARARLPRRARGPCACALRDQAIADAALADMPPAYRRLDTGVLEALLLKGALGLSDEDISHLRDFGYARDAAQAIELVDAGAYDAAFLLRPTPVEQVREIAAAGVNMPPKSTYFFPKVPTGLLFNPLA